MICSREYATIIQSSKIRKLGKNSRKILEITEFILKAWKKLEKKFGDYIIHFKSCEEEESILLNSRVTWIDNVFKPPLYVDLSKQAKDRIFRSSYWLDTSQL